ncbi:MAG: 1-acyl-sn-glycerol-3-phosphate acyltransferase [Myxococcales bacterium]|nr:1-acyl-sn-glycerol-3-phosphate acyltransferase [Myxococcales bacterium]
MLSHRAVAPSEGRARPRAGLARSLRLQAYLRAARVAHLWRLPVIAVVVGIYFAAAPLGYTILTLIARVPSRDPARRAKVLQAIMRRAFLLMHDTLRMLRLLDFDPRDVPAQLPEGPCVLIANHPCHADVTAIMATFHDVVTAVKPSIYRRRWLRPLMEGSGQFEGAADGLLDVAPVIDAAVARLQSGFNVLVFPEGTRSPVEGLHRFGRTAFEIARRAGVPVVPILIEYWPRWLTKEQPLFRAPRGTPTMRLRTLEWVYPSEDSVASRHARDVIYDRIRGELVREMESKRSIESELKEMIVECLMLDDVKPEEIETEAPLFVEGLGLDSIDALELALAMHEKFGVKTSEDDERNREIFYSVKSLADFIRAEQAAGRAPASAQSVREGVG